MAEKYNFSCSITDSDDAHSELFNQLHALFGTKSDDRDSWSRHGHYVVRHHNKLRNSLFTPLKSSVESLANPGKLSHVRVTKLCFDDGSTETIQDDWTDDASSHRKMDKSWTGVTIFAIRRTVYEGYAGKGSLGCIKRARPDLFYPLVVEHGSECWEEAAIVWKRNNPGGVIDSDHLTAPPEHFKGKDILLVTPECQPFSPGRLTDVAADDDSRSQHLYRCVEPLNNVPFKLRPLSVLLENVPEILYSEAYKLLLSRMHGLGYACSAPVILDNLRLGGSSNRIRVFLLGLRDDQPNIDSALTEWEKQMRSLPPNIPAPLRAKDIIGRVRDRPSSHRKLLREFIPSGIRQRENYDGPRWIATLAPDRRSAAAADYSARMFDDSAPCPAQLTSGREWYPKFERGTWFGVRLTSRESADVNNIPSDSDIGEDLDSEGTFDVSQPLVGNGIPIKMLTHAMVCTLAALDTVDMFGFKFSPEVLR